MPTPTERTLADGDLVMFSISPRYNGYASSVGDTTVVGGAQSEAQKRLLSDMAHAFEIARNQLVVGRTGKQMDAPVREPTCSAGAMRPTCWCPTSTPSACSRPRGRSSARAARLSLQPNMTVCIDVSLFGMPDLHGARFETGYVITEAGPQPLAPSIDDLILSHC